LLTSEELKNARARYEGTALENITSWYQYYFVSLRLFNVVAQFSNKNQ